MSRPNFFIIGAPKCGTTSLAFWLSEHPSVYMSRKKEPHHYCFDFRHNNYYQKRDRYLALFDGVERCHTAIGEASVWYLYSEEAVSNILKEIPDAKFIVMLRNPIEMAPSLHEQLLFNSIENQPDFERAWFAQQRRASGEDVSKFYKEPRFLMYREACSLGSQALRLSAQVNSSRIFFLFLDELKDNPRHSWINLLRFLQLKDDGRNNFPVLNKAKEWRTKTIPWLDRTYKHLQKSIGFSPLGSGLMTYLSKANIRTRPREPLTPVMKETLKSAFSQDIVLLGEITKRDLSHWLSR
jgi:hypothetical protein